MPWLGYIIIIIIIITHCEWRAVKFHKINGPTCPKPRESSIEPSEDVMTRGWYGRGSMCICSWHTLTHTHARVESIAVSLCSEKRQTIIITRLHAPRHHRHKSCKVRNGHLNYYRYGDKRVGWRSHIWHTYYITLCDVLYIII